MNKIVKNIKKITKSIQEGIEEIHYNINDSAPWLKLYGTKIPKNINLSTRTIYEEVEYIASLYPSYNAYEYYGKKLK